jgi:ribonuclease BN (tRNA processing enzyme)
MPPDEGDMRLTILGTRGNIERSAPGYSKHSGILVDDRILLDAGERDYLRLRPQFVFITHLHPDHAAIRADDVPKGTSIYAPECARTLPMIQVISKPAHVNGYNVIPVPTVHSQRVKSVGYVVERNGKRFLYSSDLVEIQPRFHHLLQDLDLVITDGSFIRPHGLIRKEVRTGLAIGHNGIPDLVRFFRRYTRLIVITHFGTWFFKDIAQARRKIESLRNGIHVLAAHDGMQLVIGSSGTGNAPTLLRKSEVKRYEV